MAAMINAGMTGGEQRRRNILGPPGRNIGNDATPAFKFKNVPSPAKDDVGAKAKASLVVGQSDPAGAGLRALTDGLLLGRGRGLTL